MSRTDQRPVAGPTDILVKLYELPPLDLAHTSPGGVTIRAPIAPEKHAVAGWVAEHFYPAWVSEVERSFANRPISCHIAVRGRELLGFACWDATMLGMWGPTGVAEEARGQGVGAALLLSTLHAMRAQGYAYAVIGGAGPVDFYLRTVGGIVIPGSSPGVYRDMLGWGEAGEG